MSLRIFNVLGREKQEFKPINEGRVNMYVCGPTVYDYSHLGHAKTYVSFDVVVRYLRHLGYDVLYVQNLTDVGHLLETGEDRILRKAQQLQAKPMQIVEHYVRSYFEDMDALNVVRPDISPRASGHIPEQIEMIQTLLDKEHAYVVNGSVYFDVTSDPDYGKLSNRRLEEQEEGSRETVRSEKHNPADFALWKVAEPEHILRWNSPWGEGFPGWHIECSAMSKKYLGDTFDIHGGGIDNIYPHNENEIAQSECANDAEFANYWMLVGSLTVDSVKMSKSLGNFTTIRDTLKVYRPEVVRMFAISAQYRSPLDYSEKSIEDLSKAWARLNDAVQLTRHQMNIAPESDEGNSFLGRLEQARKDFTEVMDDDFNTPKAIAVLQDLTRDVNSLLNGEATVGLPVLNEIASTYQTLAGDVLGIMPDASAPVAAGDSEREGKLIEMLIAMRAQARADKNYAESDRIRDSLADMGVILEDRADGTIWKIEA
ncbi:MAG: cysteine--tRNA ligase [Anaerolineae bacterium]|nr:cysteine--tRNA ligase [Anaerolineae bacterium]MCA9893266.1 cysteine--tRNA ligase [Anaerolineae bacterium]MCB9461227.1 cysteine--tRNA ligase [Anaerolineaceae bacterium]